MAIFAGLYAYWLSPYYFIFVPAADIGD